MGRNALLQTILAAAAYPKTAPLAKTHHSARAHCTAHRQMASGSQLLPSPKNTHSPERRGWQAGLGRPSQQGSGRVSAASAQSTKCWTLRHWMQCELCSKLAAGTDFSVLLQLWFLSAGKSSPGQLTQKHQELTLKVLFTQRVQRFTVPSQHVPVQLLLPFLQVLPLLLSKASSFTFRRLRALQL